ncbi:50S ribosomal protein L11 methyltransferase [Lacticaseibacillus zhaodongensis]|uniref:50S ribosomal protein L11 methyltransferase n=1 Tax=Lacticaseibacillus zhaodongensis TaxID=2668065 RepID=UPI0012D2EF35|nr:50S ribosomal protein L11 methyltransferase [Lacticaseibacillus zhaodongensis]
MEWLTIKVDTTPGALEPVSNILFAAGAEGTQIEDHSTNNMIAADRAIISGYFAESVNITELIANVQSKVSGLTEFGFDVGAGTVSSGAVDDASWVKVWEKYYHAVRISRYLTVVPRWEEYTPQQVGEIQLIMDPGKAFGTGTHPSTRLTLGLLEGCLRGGEDVLDVGTGSGILAIAAMKMGAKQVLATDLEEDAVASAEFNINLNIVDHITVKQSNLLNGIETTADLVLANMLPVALVPLIPQVTDVLKPGGNFLLAGIISEKADLIKKTLTDNGFKVVEERRSGDWVALRAQHAAEVE